MSGRSDDPNSLRNEVFTRVFDANWAAVRHHIECVVEDDSEVTELVSEVFLAAWTKLSTRRPMGRAWLLRVADRRLRDRLGRTADRPAITEAVHSGIFGDEAAPSVGHEQILRALSGLRVRERRIIMLTYWDGLTAGEIVESMGVTRPGAERILRRAQQKLRRSLGLEGRT
ncbi:sigma-70 family RNA polymerase sigma factor [Streptomyces sp. AC495_CC817]|uniref:sigma-70 family RNA polymerase sigma factor n=1 Tax=Streptomyces sp. AC495_CC817 TaxID=2823900 RepID=UPI001C267B41|nr:sigma-70 family RNA polymerase sigma factor [Streptomyces sp. AC495_CC817]